MEALRRWLRGESSRGPVYRRHAGLRWLALPFALMGKLLRALGRLAALVWRGVRALGARLWALLGALGRGLGRIPAALGRAFGRLGAVRVRAGRALRAWRARRPRRRLRDLPIRATFVLYTLAALFIAALVSLSVIQICANERAALRERYAALAEVHAIPERGRYTVADRGDEASYAIYDASNNWVDGFTVNYRHQTVEYAIGIDDETFSGAGDDMAALDDTLGIGGDDGVYMVEPQGRYSFIVEARQTRTDRFTSIMTIVISVLAVPITFGLSLIACATLFFRRKLRRPIALLTRSSDRIARNDLDFTVAYDSRNEMGQLCRSFETMRGALAQNNREMWRSIEERRRLNAAFSHDLRTPLTVLKGHASMLLSAAEEGGLSGEEIVSEVTAMSNSIARLERYVDAMASLQRLEDVEVNRENVPFEALAESLRDSAEILCAGKRLTFETLATSSGTLRVDREIVQQVYENILANGVRYADQAIAVRMWTSGGQLLIRVKDDGPGFSAADLEKATNAFYRGAGRSDSHLGLGLNICKVLCERHGGGIQLENAGEGGGRVTAAFDMR